MDPRQQQPIMESESTGGKSARPDAPRAVRFTYLDFLELRAWEFAKFRGLPPITAEEIAAIDWDALCARVGREPLEP